MKNVKIGRKGKRNVVAVCFCHGLCAPRSVVVVCIHVVAVCGNSLTMFLVVFLRRNLTSCVCVVVVPVCEKRSLERQELVSL